MNNITIKSIECDVHGGAAIENVVDDALLLSKMNGGATVTFKFNTFPIRVSYKDCVSHILKDWYKKVAVPGFKAGH